MTVAEHDGSINFLDDGHSKTSQQDSTLTACNDSRRASQAVTEIEADNRAGFMSDGVWKYGGYKARILNRAICESVEVVVLPCRQPSICICRAFHPRQCLHDPRVVIADQIDWSFCRAAIVHSMSAWVDDIWSSTMEHEMRYTAADVFETFPFPSNLQIQLGRHRRVETRASRQTCCERTGRADQDLQSLPRPRRDRPPTSRSSVNSTSRWIRRCRRLRLDRPRPRPRLPRNQAGHPLHHQRTRPP